MSDVGPVFEDVWMHRNVVPAPGTTGEDVYFEVICDRRKQAWNEEGADLDVLLVRIWHSPYPSAVSGTET